MALRNQPYIPLYVQDILTDEKLILCSAESHGIYLRLLCLLHKQENYGQLIIKQKYKQNGSKYKNFASVLVKQMPFTLIEIERSLVELHDEDVIQISESMLSQKRMVKDGKLSIARAYAGSKGGSKTQSKQSSKQSSKTEASTEYENEYEYK